MIKVLFICHGNICRSPMAEFVMKKKVTDLGVADRFYIESAATTTEEIGNPVYPPARKILAQHGIGCEGKTARIMTKKDYARFDHIIGMDEENRYDMKWIAGGDPDNKISCLMDYTDRPRNVADPWYTRNFEATWNDVCEGCDAFLSFLGFK